MRPTALRSPLRPFEELVEEHGALVLRVCRALVGPAEAADAWSETFLAALQAYPRLAPGSHPRAWLVTIAQRKAVDLLRGAARRPKAGGALSDRAGRPESAADEDLRAALARLPERQRKAVVYRHLAGLTYAEIGAQLGSNPAAARRSVADGIAQLRGHFARKQGTRA